MIDKSIYTDKEKRQTKVWNLSRSLWTFPPTLTYAKPPVCFDVIYFSSANIFLIISSRVIKRLIIISPACLHIDFLFPPAHSKATEETFNL